MPLARTLTKLGVVSLVFLATISLLVWRGDISISKLPWTPALTAIDSDAASLSRFDAQLHPELHSTRDPKTLEFDWVIRQESRSPDGVKKSIYTVNGLFPGPTIEARPGDRLLLRVHNDLATETTAIHFHGIRHLGSNSMDGAPGLTQCAIQPKHSLLYNFTISLEQSGTFWWHSHSHTQRADGLYGGLIIHDPVTRQPDIGHVRNDLRIRKKDTLFSERILMIGDWYHRNATEMLAWYRSKKSNGWEPTPETALYNGINAFDCSRASRFVECDATKGRKPSLFLDPKSTTRLRLVNTGNLADFEISLGSHNFIVVEADGSPVSPQRVNSVNLSPGQRYSVIIEPLTSIQPSVGDSFWLRLTMSEECFNIPNAALDMEQYVQVNYGDPQVIRSSGEVRPFELDTKIPDFDLFSLVPLQRTPLPAADEQIMIYVNSMKLDHLGGIPYGYVNQTSWVPPSDPLLLRNTDTSLADGWGEHQLVVTTDRKEARVIEMIINNLDEGPHPFHLHGHSFYPLLTFRSTIGWGMYNYTAGHIVPDESPVLRDTLTIPRRGHAVIRFLADAPGMWLFHCHVLVHLSTGMAMTFNVRPDLVPQYEKQSVLDGCTSQNATLN